MFVTREQSQRAARSHGAIEQQSVQHFARVDHDRMVHFESRAVPADGNQFGGAHNFLGLGAVQQEGVRFDCLMCEPASARLLPREPLVEDGTTRNPFRARRSPQSAPAGPPPNNRNVFHHQAMSRC